MQRGVPLAPRGLVPLQRSPQPPPTPKEPNWMIYAAGAAVFVGASVFLYGGYRYLTSSRKRSPKPTAKVGASVSEEARNLQADRIKEEGNALFRLGDLDGAIAKYSQSVAMFPNNVKYLANRALSLLEQRHPELALPDATRITKLDPGFSKGFHLLGLAQKGVAFEEGDVELLKKAIAAFHQAKKLNPSNAKASMRIDECERQLQEWKELQDAEQAAEAEHKPEQLSTSPPQDAPLPEVEETEPPIEIEPSANVEAAEVEIEQVREEVIAVGEELVVVGVPAAAEQPIQIEETDLEGEAVGPLAGAHEKENQQQEEQEEQQQDPVTVEESEDKNEIEAEEAEATQEEAQQQDKRGPEGDLAGSWQHTELTDSNLASPAEEEPK